MWGVVSSEGIWRSLKRVLVPLAVVGYNLWSVQELGKGFIANQSVLLEADLVSGWCYLGCDWIKVCRSVE